MIEPARVTRTAIHDDDQQRLMTEQQQRGPPTASTGRLRGPKSTPLQNTGRRELEHRRPTRPDHRTRRVGSDSPSSTERRGPRTPRAGGTGRPALRRPPPAGFGVGDDVPPRRGFARDDRREVRSSPSPSETQPRCPGSGPGEMKPTTSISGRPVAAGLADRLRDVASPGGLRASRADGWVAGGAEHERRYAPRRRRKQRHNSSANAYRAVEDE